MSSSSSPSPRNWKFDVFVSFRGEDVREGFLAHFVRELDRKAISVFKDNMIEKSQSLDPVLKKAIKESRLAVVLFSENYASSSWCLNELLEIVNCKNEFGQMVIPVFYRLDPSHVRNQTGNFGNVFESTCTKNKKTMEKIRLWQEALKEVANIVGFHPKNWENESKLIEDIISDVLEKLNKTPSKDINDFVGIEDHIAKMSLMLDLKSEEVRMVGIWGPSGIGKTTIARLLFNRLSPHFQVFGYINRFTIAEMIGDYSKGNPTDYNMRLVLQEKFLSKLLDTASIKVHHLGAVREKLKHLRVLIFIDDLDDQVVLDTLVGGDEWFGPWSRIVVVTKDKHTLRAHGIERIYEVPIPSENVALQMFCGYAFRQNAPPDDFMELASEVVVCAGSLPLGLNLLGSSLRGRNKKYWIDMLPTLRKGLDGKIEKALKVSYDALEREEYKALFRHIACFLNGYKIDDIKLMLAGCVLNVDTGFEILFDKSLISLIPNTSKVEMHCLLQEMGKQIVYAQSDKPGKREYLLDSESVCDVLEHNAGTKKVIGLSLNIDETDELRIHKETFKGMSNIRFLNFYSNKWDGRTWHLPEGLDYLPPKLRFLRLDNYPLRYMPSSLHLGNLVELIMRHSKLEKLWDGPLALTGLQEIRLDRSENLKEIPDLSMAIHLKTLRLNYCSSLVELSSSIRYLNKLEVLEMSYCKNLENLPTGMNLESLYYFNLTGCSRLKSFPNISTNIKMLDIEETAIEEFPTNLRLEKLTDCNMNGVKNEKLWGSLQPLTPLMTMLSPNFVSKLCVSDIPTLVELPSSFQNFRQLFDLSITNCINLETLPAGINLPCLFFLNLSGCSRLRTFPDISTTISYLYLSYTAIEEVPLRIKNFSRLRWLNMEGCKNLKSLPIGINIETLFTLDLCGCSQLKSFPDISTNMSALDLSGTAIEEVPWWIEDFSELEMFSMNNCNNLQSVSLKISKLKHLYDVSFSNCGTLKEASWKERSSVVAMKAESIQSGLPREDSSSIPDESFPKLDFYFDNCFNLDEESLLQKQSDFNLLILPGKEMPSYFTHQTTGTSLTNIPLLQTSLSKPSFRFRACVVLGTSSSPIGQYINICCRFRCKLGNYFDSPYQHQILVTFVKVSEMVVFDCCFPLNEDNAPPAEVNYDYVDIQFHVLSYDHELKGCGIHLFEDDVISSGDNDSGSEIECSEDCPYRDDYYLSSETDCSEGCDYGDVGDETDHSEEFLSCSDSDLASETDDREECEYCNDTESSQYRV